jgi:hypothetical protein
MKRNHKTIIPGALTLFFALVALVGSQSFLGPCVHEDGSFGTCHWAGQALLGVSVLNLAESICILAGKSSGFRRGLYTSAALTGVLGILLPGPLIGLCGMATMRCRMVMRPAMTILFSLISVTALVGALLSREEVRVVVDGNAVKG